MKKVTRKELDDAREKLASTFHSLVRASKELLQPLKGLDEVQTAAVVTLAATMRIALLAGRASVGVDKGLLAQLEGTIDEFCPPIRSVSIAKDPCFEATVAYGSALAECEKHGQTEDECMDAWGPGAEAVMCTMRELEEMRGFLGDIWQRITPPRPFPWPY